MARLRVPLIAFVAAATFLAAACGGNPSSPALTDPVAIVTAALKSAEAAKSVHLDIRVDGTATIALPGAATGTGAPVNLDGTTAAVDVDFVAPAARATLSAPALLGFKGEIIGIDDAVYVKTTLTGPLYQKTTGAGAPVDPSDAGGMVDNLGDLLLKEGVVLTKGPDAPCGSETCYSVTTKLTPEQLGVDGAAAAGGLPINLAGATLDLTILVEQDSPNHLAGIDGTLTMADGSALEIEVAADGWDEPVTITAPPADQVKPAP